MPLPGKRIPRRRTRIRRSHHALKPANLATCSHCGAKTAGHRACSACGYYAGKPARKAEPAPKPYKKATVKAAPKKAAKK
jgi:large subunit ribosomal protein L32